jgi:hypothetical protein
VWWYPACSKCNKASTPYQSGYKCQSCDLTIYRYMYRSIQPRYKFGGCYFKMLFPQIFTYIITSILQFSLMVRYKLTFMARDETPEAMMFCFDSIAKRIVGKPCETVLRSSVRTPTYRYYFSQSYIPCIID